MLVGSKIGRFLIVNGSVLILDILDKTLLWSRRLALTDWEEACGCAIGFLFKWPRAVASEFGMCFRTIVAVRRGNWLGPDKYPLRTACRKVVGGGLPMHA